MAVPSSHPLPGTHSGNTSSARFAGELDRFRRRLDAALDHRLRAAQDRIAGDTPCAAELTRYLRRLVQAGGKRLRPALVVFACRAAGGEVGDRAWAMAEALELFHTYLLVHDDIMDRAHVRRGLPSAPAYFSALHQAGNWRGDRRHFGNAAAILVGDLAHALALERATEAMASHPAASRLRRAFFRMSEEVIAGQHLEMEIAARGRATAEEIGRVLHLKSGAYTVERPIQLGALLGGADDETVAQLRMFGRDAGEAFQLQDDLMGIFGDPEEVGKPVGGDLAEGKRTFLVYYALEGASQEARRRLEALLGRDDLDAGDVEEARTLMRESGALERVERMIQERLERAHLALERLSLSSEGRELLAGFVDYLPGRRS